MGTARSRIYMPYSYFYKRTRSIMRLYGSLPPTIWPKMGEYKQCPRFGFKTRNHKKEKNRALPAPMEEIEEEATSTERIRWKANRSGEPEGAPGRRTKQPVARDKRSGEHEGEKKDPFCPLPLYTPQMSTGSTAPGSASTGPVATWWLRAVLPLQK